MGAKATNRNVTYEEQLSELENRLRRHDSEEAMLGDVGLAMRTLLARNGESEAHIRQLLERQFEQGNLRPESYELVERLLGKIVAEEKDAASKAAAEPAGEEVPYVDTEVLDDPTEPSELDEIASPQLQVGSVLRDRFLLKEKIADGGMGTVYKAMDRRLAETGESDPFVAIKVLNSRLSRNSVALRALQQEAAKGRCLAHPNIVRFIDLDREGDEFFIVMEWLEGKSLARILDDSRGNKLSPSVALDVIRQVGNALSYAHQRGVVHADIKPGNIIISPDGKATLIDFGVARVRQKENEGKSRFDPNVMRAGSPAYSSMQVLTGEDPVPADDVFSLACLAYRLLAGYRVFGPRNAADAAQEGMEPQRPNEVGDRQWAAMKKALAYSRVTRYESPKAFLDAFGTASPGPDVPGASSPAKKTGKQASQPKAVVETPDIRLDATRDNLRHDETTEVAIDSPMRAERDSIMYEADESSRRSPWRLLVFGALLVGAAFVATNTRMIDDIPGLESGIESLTRFLGQVVPPETADPEGIEDLPPLPETDVVDTADAPADEGVTDSLVVDETAGAINEEPVSQPEPPTVTADVEIADASLGTPLAGDETPADPAPAEPVLPPPIDFSGLPEADLVLTLGDPAAGDVSMGDIAIREGGEDVILDFVREGDLVRRFPLRIVEPSFSGSTSAMDAGRYRIADEGLVVFEPGQPRVRTTISMPSNSTREDDRQVTLSVRNALNQREELAIISLSLEDDDQRAFEAGLPPNTIGFTVSTVDVREFDPAVQLDIIRYRPDNTAIEIPYSLTDISATQGEDYFAPGLPVVYFGPGQRTARVLIPLGQDGRSEVSESFIVALDAPVPPERSNIYRQITVMIRDDDS